MESFAVPSYCPIQDHSRPNSIIIPRGLFALINRSLTQYSQSAKLHEKRFCSLRRITLRQSMRNRCSVYEIVLVRNILRQRQGKTGRLCEGEKQKTTRRNHWDVNLPHLISIQTISIVSPCPVEFLLDLYSLE